MATTKKTAVAVAAGVLALGAGVGVASLASADPTPSPSTTPSTGNAAPGVPDGHGPRGDRGELASALAEKLGVDQAKLTEALRAYREANRPSAGSTPDPNAKPDPAARDEALATFLAERLGLDPGKVSTALAEIRAERQAERAAALKERLDAAVQDGTLTQAEADAVTKAVEKGVIGGGLGRR